MDNSEESRRAYFEELRKRNRTPHFPFVNLPPTERLVFEMLTEDNMMVIYELFKDDENPFVEKYYKDEKLLKECMDIQLYQQRFSAKRGACDWLMKLKETQTYVGLLNLYNLSLEDFNDNHKKCMIGFSTSAAFRRKGYTQEAVLGLMEHIAVHYQRNIIRAYAKKDNLASKGLLQKIGFQNCNNEYDFTEQYDYFELVKEVC
ncbi:MAG: GNAT family N-acetyltransferase [Bacteroidota bacterium]